MPIHLLVAIFDVKSLAEKVIQDAVDTHPDFVRALSTLTLFDRMVDNTVAARKGGSQLLFMSGGTIPDRGYFHMRHLSLF